MATLGADAGYNLAGLKIVKIKLSLLLPVKVFHRFIINTTVSLYHLHFLSIHLKNNEK
jgi:hypothetical protein